MTIVDDKRDSWRSIIGDISPFTTLLFITAGSGLCLSAFDLLRVTVFRNANWNYNYQYWNYVYDIPIVILLLIVFLCVIYTASHWLALSPRQFSFVLFIGTSTIFTLGLFMLPLELTKALHVDKRGLYNGAVYLINNGLLDFLRSFHTLPQTAPANPDLYVVNFDITQDDPVADSFSDWMSENKWVPFNKALTSYVGDYTTQKHGPVSVLFVAPFLILFGTSTAAALAGNIIIAALIPVIGYYTFQLYFSDIQSKIGAVLVGSAPSLFIWTRHAAPVPYDVITSFLVALSLYVFLRGIREADQRLFGIAGVCVALATMTKITGLVVVLPIILLLYLQSDTIGTAVKRASVMAGSWSVVVLTFVAAGYNAIAQLLYTSYKTTLYKIQKGSGGGRPGGHPADVLNDGLISYVGTIYNIRWMNVVLLILAGVFLAYIVSNRSFLMRDKHAISAALLTAFTPFSVFVLFSSGTISRHTFILIVPLGFIALSGVSLLTERIRGGISRQQLVRFCQLSLLIGMAQFMINV